MNKFLKEFRHLEQEIESAVHNQSTPSAEPRPDEPAETKSAEPAAASERPKAQQQLRRLEAKLKEKIDLCAEKDLQIAAVLNEGEMLSKRQAEQEQTIKKLRVALREAQTAAEQHGAEAATLRAQLAAAAEGEGKEGSREGGKGGANCSADGDELGAAEQLASVQAAFEAELGAAAEREAALSESVRELQLDNARLSQAARLRDEGLAAQLGELSARSDAAEAQAKVLADAVLQETEPLLKQIASLQQGQQQMQAAWRSSEAALRGRLREAEAAATARGNALVKLQAHIDSLTAELEEQRSAARAAVESERAARVSAEEAVSAHARAAAVADTDARRWELQHERARALLLDAERRAAEAKSTAESLEQELRREREVARELRRSHQQELDKLRQSEAARQAASAADVDELRTPRAPTALYTPKPATAATVSARAAEPQHGELAELRQQVRAMERRHSQLISQLATLHAEREQLQAENGSLRAMASEFSAMREQHAIALEMLGEKEEQLEALRGG
uniref:TATA element modulatory factor 1 TATA binding domain-containing protein n=1 Tax=Chrysotila carterae TaxID=13221 RepID=A0A7S4BBZ3_CHRCT